MDSNLLKTKSIEQLVGDVEHGGRPQATLTAFDLNCSASAPSSDGHLRADGTAAATRPDGDHHLLLAAGSRAVSPPLLCGIRLHDPISGSAYTYA